MSQNLDLETTGSDNAQGAPLVFLPWTEVVRRTSLSRSSIDRMIEAGGFPHPVRLGPSRKAWVEAELIEWQHKILLNRT